MTISVNGVLLDTQCVSARMKGSILCLNCQVSPTQMQVILLPDTDSQYESALAWVKVFKKLAE